MKEYKVYFDGNKVMIFTGNGVLVSNKAVVSNVGTNTRVYSSLEEITITFLMEGPKYYEGAAFDVNITDPEESPTPLPEGRLLSLFD